MSHQTPALVAQFGDAKADYKAASRSNPYLRRKRGLPAMGASADWHLRSETDRLYIGELAREIDRNDMLAGVILDGAVRGTIGDGFQPNPMTGDKELDQLLVDRWFEEAVDPDKCDPNGQLTFIEQERLVIREMLTAGEVFCLPTPSGAVDLHESHRNRSPQRKSKTNDSIVHGIEFEPNTRRPLRYWFTRESVNPDTPVHRQDLLPVPAFDAEGEALVWHIFRRKRPTQSHGITAFQPIFDAIAMQDDIHFATLLKQQLSAFFLLVRQRSASFFENNPRGSSGPGERQDVAATADATRRMLHDVRPGAEIGGDPGETITPWSPNIPSDQWFTHMRLILQIVGVNLGMPLVLILMDGSETNYSGYRGAIDQARDGWRDNQRLLAAKFHCPYWRHKLNVWADADPVLGRYRAQLKGRFFAHEWGVPSWPYIEPVKDAMADLVRDAHMLQSPRRRYQERGLTFETVVRETIADRAFAIRLALTEAEAINTEYRLSGDAALRWRDLAPLPVPERVNISLTETGDPKPETKPAAPAALPAAA
jgi:capsid protein